MRRNGRDGLAQEIRTAIQTLRDHGRTDAGLMRLAYTPAWCAAMDEVGSWLADAGLTVRRDAVGNLFGRVDGRDGEHRAILTGSHLDSIVGGGDYDGVAGVVCAFVAVSTLLRTHGQPRRPLEVVAISDEESSRFKSSFWGSRAIVGRARDAEVDELCDTDGFTLRTAIRQAGLPDLEVGSCRRDDIEAFLELHIEQGPLLEREGLPVGVVTAITGTHYSEHTVVGVSNHAGGAPMSGRKDPMQAAAEMIGRVEQVAHRFGDPARGTVGSLVAQPGAANAIPASVTFTADLRHPDPSLYGELVSDVIREFRLVADRRQVELRSTTHIDEPPTPLDPTLVATLRDASVELDFTERLLPSGGGHDSMIMARSGIPSAMIFVRCRDGVSHSPAEFANEHDLAAGTEVLIHTLHRLAY